MKMAQEEVKVHCPYCGEMLHVLVDCSVPQQDYIEDCQVCCRPINFAVSVSEGGEVCVVLAQEND